MQIGIFFHVATVGSYTRVVDEMHHVLSESGLIGAASVMRYGVVGGGIFAPSPEAPADTKIRSDTNLETGEFLTLAMMEEVAASASEPMAMLYLHTKGVTKPDNPCIEDWRNLMLHFNVRRYRDALSILTTADACGVDLRRRPAPHFSGNFWWASRSYLATLPPIRVAMRRLPPRRGPLKRGRLSLRHNAEFWIGMSQGKLVSLHQSGINVYKRHLHRYTPDRYS